MSSPWLKKNDYELYKDEFKHTKLVGRDNFIHKFDSINPLSSKYIPYWKKIKRRCIEGYWCEGKWMPGNLYFYINVSKILLNKTLNSKTKSLGSPNLRDLEWEKAYVLMEARGFSGFKDDTEYTCKQEVKNLDDEKSNEKRKLMLDDYIKYGFLTDNCFKDKEKRFLKKYVSPRFYLRLIHATNLGKPLFENNASNVMDIEARRLGKSYWSANGIAVHNFLFDGATDYDEYLQALTDGDYMSSETVIGAIEAKYSNDLCSKVELTLDYLQKGDKYGPHPFHKETSGSLEPSEMLVSGYSEKVNGTQWVDKGSNSKIHNRTFRNKPTAGNGTGANIILIEEIGFMDNLVESLSHLKDATMEGTSKFGTVYGFGTSGEMESGKSNDAKVVFENPEQFDCLSFDNVWEESSSIGFFVPYIYRLDRFSDSEGNVNKEKATEFAKDKREKLKKGKNDITLKKEFQNNPLTPSDAFLTTGVNKFPVNEMKEHLLWLKGQNALGKLLPQNGELIYTLDEHGKEDNSATLKWSPDLENNLIPCWFNMKENDNKTGCIQIYEHPIIENGKPIPSLYLAGNDPYDQDDSTTSSSLGSTFIYKKFYNDEGVNHEVVAEYTARPETSTIHHENVRRLLLYYDARLLYENEKITLKVHFEHNHSLYLLSKKPNVISSAEESKVDRIYGVHMSTNIKKDCVDLLNAWLRQKREDDKLNLHSIKSVPLLEELINYNDTGNFDRVISFMLTIVNVEQNYFVEPDKAKIDEKLNSFIQKMKNGGFY